MRYWQVVFTCLCVLNQQFSQGAPLECELGVLSKEVEIVPNATDETGADDLVNVTTRTLRTPHPDSSFGTEHTSYDDSETEEEVSQMTLAEGIDEQATPSVAEEEVIQQACDIVAETEVTRENFAAPEGCSIQAELNMEVNHKNLKKNCQDS